MAITFDSVADVASGGSFTVPAGNYKLVVVACASYTDDTPATSLTVGGIACTMIRQTVYSTSMIVQIWYAILPTGMVGAQACVNDIARSMTVWAFLGAHPTKAPVDWGTSGASLTDIALTVDTINNGCTISYVKTGTGDGTNVNCTDAIQTVDSETGRTGYGHVVNDPDASVSLTWDWTGTRNAVLCAASFYPAIPTYESPIYYD